MQATISMGIMVLVIGLVFWRRTRAMVQPIKGSGIRLLLPCLFILPAFTMFMNPQLHLTTLEVTGAFAIGLLLGVPMILTTNYEVREDGQIYAKKSMAFIFALIGVYVIRIVLRYMIPGLDSMTLSALFMTTAITYVVIWRVTSYLKFRAVYQVKHVYKSSQGQ